MDKYLDTIKTQWNTLPPAAQKAVIGVGAYVGIASTLGILAGRVFNGGFFAGKVKSNRRLDGHCAIVTGANSGSGYAISLELLERGCDVIITCRNEKKARDTISRLKQELQSCETKIGQLYFLLLDLGSRNSVDKFLNDFESLNITVNILVNNAGAWIQTPEITKDGIEKQWQVNYYSPFYITNKLLPHIIKCASERRFGRIVNVSSMAHQTATIDVFNGFINDNKRDDINFWSNKDSMQVYGDTKCAQICHAKRLQEEVNKMFNITDGGNNGNNGEFIVGAAHPGWIDSGFANLSTRRLPMRVGWTLLYPFLRLGMLNWKQGAQTPLHIILDEEGVKPGGYHTHCWEAPTISSADEVIATKTDELYEKSLTIWQ